MNVNNKPLKTNPFRNKSRKRSACRIAQRREANDNRALNCKPECFDRIKKGLYKCGRTKRLCGRALSATFLDTLAGPLWTWCAAWLCAAPALHRAKTGHKLLQIFIVRHFALKSQTCDDLTFFNYSLYCLPKTKKKDKLNLHRVQLQKSYNRNPR